MEVAVFREKYFRNCENLHKAQAIVGVFYPDMVNTLNKIYDLTNVFWGYQEQLLKIDISEDLESWNYAQRRVMEAAKEFYIPICDLQELIEDRAKKIQEEFQRPVKEVLIA